MKIVGVEEWVIRAVKAIYENAKSCVRVNGQFCDEFNIKVGVHQGPAPSPLLFIIVMEALSREFKVGCLWELLYKDDLVLMAETLEDLKKKLTIWKDNIEAKGLRVNVNKTKLVCSKHNSSVKSDPVKWPCNICRKGVSKNSIFCQSCNHWVHKRCSKIKGRLKADPSFKCDACTNNIMTISQDDPEVIIGNDKFEAVHSFRYLDDSTGQSGSCFEATTDTVRAAWKNFHSLLPVLTNSRTSLNVKGYNACIRSVLLCASETWAVKIDDIHRIVRNDNAMVTWICSAKLCEKIPLSDLRTRMGISSIEDIIRYNRFRCFGHLQRMDEEKWRRKILNFEVNGSYPRGRPRKKWFDNIRSDLDKLRLSTSLAQDRSKYRSAIKPSRHAAEEEKEGQKKGKRTINWIVSK